MVNLVLVHERFTDFAGSEMVVEQFATIWPDAPILAPIVNPAVLPPGMPVKPSWLNSVYRDGGYAHLLPLLPIAMRHLPVPSDAQAVLASHHAFANQVVCATEAPVISYVHSPARWMWDAAMREGEFGGKLGELGIGAFSASQRRRDYEAAQKVHSFIANSHAVADRIRRWWDRDSVVVFPPVDTDFYQPDPQVQREDFVLVAGRMVPYKHPEIAIAAAERAGIRVVVAGDGRAMLLCRKAAGPMTTFVGRVSDHELRALYRRCACLVMPGEEDAGIVPLEAQACGAPIVALGRGGACDSVIDGATGILVVPRGDIVADFASALRDAMGRSWDHAAIVEHAQSFSRPAFRNQIKRYVESTLGSL